MLFQTAHYRFINTHTHILEFYTFLLIMVQLFFYWAYIYRGTKNPNTKHGDAYRMVLTMVKCLPCWPPPSLQVCCVNGSLPRGERWRVRMWVHNGGLPSGSWGHGGQAVITINTLKGDGTQQFYRKNSLVTNQGYLRGTGWSDPQAWWWTWLRIMAIYGW